LNNILTLKSGLDVTQGHSNWYHSKAWVRFYSPSIVTMALSCISSKIKPDIGRKLWFFHTPLHSTPTLGGSPSEYWHPVWCGKTRVVRLHDGGKKTEDICNYLDSIPACYRQTDGRTDRHLATA